MENTQGGLGRLEDAYDREDSPVWLHPCVCGAVPRLCQAQDCLGPLVVRTQGWWLRFGLSEIYRKEPNKINHAPDQQLCMCHDLAPAWGHDSETNLHNNLVQTKTNRGLSTKLL